MLYIDFIIVKTSAATWNFSHICPKRHWWENTKKQKFFILFWACLWLVSTVGHKWDTQKHAKGACFSAPQWPILVRKVGETYQHIQMALCDQVHNRWKKKADHSHHKYKKKSGGHPVKEILTNVMYKCLQTDALPAFFALAVSGKQKAQIMSGGVTFSYLSWFKHICLSCMNHGQPNLTPFIWSVIQLLWLWHSWGDKRDQFCSAQSQPWLSWVFYSYF